jgi:hypothetical protein
MRAHAGRAGIWARLQRYLPCPARQCASAQIESRLVVYCHLRPCGSQRAAMVRLLLLVFGQRRSSSVSCGCVDNVACTILPSISHLWPISFSRSSLSTAPAVTRYCMLHTTTWPCVGHCPASWLPSLHTTLRPSFCGIVRDPAMWTSVPARQRHTTMPCALWRTAPDVV